MRQLTNHDGDRADISDDAMRAGRRLIDAQPPIVAGGQGRDPQDIIDGGTILAFVLAAAGLAATVYMVWRHVGGGA